MNTLSCFQNFSGENFGVKNFRGNFCYLEVMRLYPLLFEERVIRNVSLAVLLWDDKVLIVKRSDNERSNPGKWGFPGGGIDHGETPLEAVIRECEEEIGVAPVNVSKLAQEGRITWFMGMLPCDPEECVRLNWEHTEWALVDVESMFGYDMIDGMEEIIDVVLE